MTEQAKQGNKGIKRSDPDSRPVDGAEGKADLLNQDPSKHYVYVNTAATGIHPGYYQALGYKFSQYDENETKPLIGWQEFKQGDRIIMDGQALMECPADRKRELDEAAWKRADALQNRIRNGDLDPLDPAERSRFRGITSRRDEDEGDDRKTWSF